VEAGYREIVLTGVDITSYGSDLPARPSLGQLIRRILDLVPDLRRLRISSIDSVEVDEPLMRVIAEEERLMPHFHLSLQAGDDMILKRMKRRHLRSQSISFCDDVRRHRPDAVFGADLIAGFPTETEEMFENSLRLIDDCGLTYLHVFPFSPRPGTPAARMPQLQGTVIKERARLLRDHGNRRLSTFFEREVGKRRHVLAETETGGRTQHFAPVRFAVPVQAGSILDADIIGVVGNALSARPSV